MINLLTLLNAADKAGITETNMEALDTSLAFQRAPSLVSGLPTTASGPPTAGTFPTDEMWVDALSALWFCTAGGTPGTWVQVTPGLAGAFPGTAPAFGYTLYRTDQNKTWTYNGGAWVTAAAGALVVSVALTNGQTSPLTVTGLALPFTPTLVIPVIAYPASGVQVSCNPAAAGITSDSFTIKFSPTIPATGYVLMALVA